MSKIRDSLLVIQYILQHHKDFSKKLNDYNNKPHIKVQPNLNLP